MAVFRTAKTFSAQLTSFVIILVTVSLGVLSYLVLAHKPLGSSMPTAPNSQLPMHADDANDLITPDGTGQ